MLIAAGKDHNGIRNR